MYKTDIAILQRCELRVISPGHPTFLRSRRALARCRRALAPRRTFAHGACALPALQPSSSRCSSHFACQLRHRLWRHCTAFEWQRMARSITPFARWQRSRFALGIRRPKSYARRHSARRLDCRVGASSQGATCAPLWPLEASFGLPLSTRQLQQHSASTSQLSSHPTTWKRHACCRRQSRHLDRHPRLCHQASRLSFLHIRLSPPVR